MSPLILSNYSLADHWDELERVLTAEAYASAWRYCTRLCATREDAEDLLQDSLIHAAAKLPQLRDRSRFRGWLLAIVRARFLNRRPTRTLELPLWYEQADVASLPSPLAGPLAEAVARLPRPQREALELYYFEELSLAECGTVLRIPVSAVRQRLFRARTGLRRMLGVWGLQSKGETT